MSASSPKVFVTQEQTKLNYLPAEKYGEIVFITCEEFSSVPSSLSNNKLLDHMWEVLGGFNPDIDYLVFSGSPTVAAAVFAIVGKMDYPKFKVLRWSNRDNIYTPIVINLDK